ncbi:hypothetical protein H2248_001267 [Termitomyces sp. 'cryptogamus']|nr:hypothetical protein H2248_001267 [Termitomyces sp. 'cryptogamus']
MTGSSKDFRVAIVGGGMCGLVCAIGLAKAGVHVETFEQAVIEVISDKCVRSLIQVLDKFPGSWSWG